LLARIGPDRLADEAGRKRQKRDDEQQEKVLHSRRPAYTAAGVFAHSALWTRFSST
jgi:hypothetical protein